MGSLEMENALGIPGIADVVRELVLGDALFNGGCVAADNNTNEELRNSGNEY